jgi:CDP-paratose synthetase
MRSPFLKRVLLTGGTGFLGSALARDLCIKGNDITVIVRKNSILERLKVVSGAVNVAVCENDEDIASVVERCRPNLVIHTACVYGRALESWVNIFDANVRLGLVILDTLRRMDTPVTFINTGTSLDGNTSPYAMSKELFTNFCRNFTATPESKIKFINVVLEHMYGPGDDVSKFSSHVIHQCYKNISKLDLTWGAQKRDFIYIDDVVAAYSVIIQNLSSFHFGENIGVGCGSAPSIKEFVEKVKLITNSSTELCFGVHPYRQHEPMHSVANISTLSALGWAPYHDLNSGLSRFIELESF